MAERGQTCSAYRIVHAVGVGFFLGKETTGGIWGMGELGSVDEVVHWWTTATTSSSCSTSSQSPSRGVRVREVKVPLAVVVVAFGDTRTFEHRGDVLQRGLFRYYGAQQHRAFRTCSRVISPIATDMLTRVWRIGTGTRPVRPWTRTKLSNHLHDIGHGHLAGTHGLETLGQWSVGVLLDVYFRLNGDGSPATRGIYSDLLKL